jgi:hypothetical protein
MTQSPVPQQRSYLDELNPIQGQGFVYFSQTLCRE